MFHNENRCADTVGRHDDHARPQCRLLGREADADQPVKFGTFLIAPG
jgi:hypothetical protein